MAKAKKSKKADVVYQVEARGMTVQLVEGVIKEIPDSGTGVVVSYKIPRRKKRGVGLFPFSQMHAFWCSSYEEGADCSIQLRASYGTIAGSESEGIIDEVIVPGFVTVSNDDGVYLVAEDSLVLSSEEDPDDDSKAKKAKKEDKKDKKTKKAKKAKKVVEDDDDTEDDDDDDTDDDTEDDDDDDTDDDTEDDDDTDDDDEDDDDDDDTDDDEDETPKKGGKGKTKSKAAKKSKDDDDDWDE